MQLHVFARVAYNAPVVVAAACTAIRVIITHATAMLMPPRYTFPDLQETAHAYSHVQDASLDHPLPVFQRGGSFYSPRHPILVASRPFAPVTRLHHPPSHPCSSQHLQPALRPVRARIPPLQPPPSPAASCILTIVPASHSTSLPTPKAKHQAVSTLMMVLPTHT